MENRTAIRQPVSKTRIRASVILVFALLCRLDCWRLFPWWWRWWWGPSSRLDYARRTFQGGERIHAIYGGLHISPLEDWDEACEQVVNALCGYGIAKVACNHRTGRTAVEKMLELGLPVVRGTARHGSQTNLFVGNGDVLEFG